MKWIIPFILLVSGCDVLQFRGITPSARSFSEDPQLSQYYMGVSAEFNVIDPADPDKRTRQDPVPPYFPEDPNVIPRPVPQPAAPW